MSQLYEGCVVGCVAIYHDVTQETKKSDVTINGVYYTVIAAGWCLAMHKAG